MIISSESEMLAFGESLAAHCQTDSPQRVFELLGDVGAGKTTLTRGLARGLGITESVTSPSFTISKSYAIPDGRTLVHYDFYRIPDPGLMADDLTESLRDPNSIVVVEWADTVHDLLPSNRTIVHISYNDDGTRTVKLSSGSDHA